MKQIFKSLVLVAAAVATLTSCEKAPEVTPTPEEYTLTVNATLPAPEDTKTYLGELDATNGYPVLWSEDDKIRLYEVSYTSEGGTNFRKGDNDSLHTSQYATSDLIERSDANATATFSGLNFAKALDEGVDYFDYVALYGNTNALSFYRRYNENGTYIQLEIPGTQTPQSLNQFDENAALMAAKSLGNSSRCSTLNLNFVHLVAYGMLNITNLDCGSEKIQSVTFTSANHNITGQSKYLYTDVNDIFSIDTKNALPGVTVNLSALNIDSENFNVPFAIAPTTFDVGDVITIEVATNKNVYRKEITLTAAQAEKFDFVQGGVLKFTANFAGVGTASVDKYKLVTDVATLFAGDKIILVGKKSSDNTYYAAGALSGSSTKTYLSSVAITAPNSEGIISITNADVDVFTMNSYNGHWRFESTIQSGKYIGWISGNYATYSATKTNQEWTISIAADGKATIINAATINSDADDDRKLQFNASNPRFVSYTSNQTLPFIYKKVN